MLTASDEVMAEMGDLQIEVWDATGNKRQRVEVPAEAEVERLVAVLIDKLNLPRHSPDGQTMSYKFHHKRSGKQLLDTDTLRAAGVQDGDILRLQPEITAGATPITAMFTAVFTVGFKNVTTALRVAG